MITNLVCRQANLATEYTSETLSCTTCIHSIIDFTLDATGNVSCRKYLDASRRPRVGADARADLAACGPLGVSHVVGAGAVLVHDRDI
jgi:hypothetical protein